MLVYTMDGGGIMQINCELSLVSHCLSRFKNIERVYIKAADHGKLSYLYNSEKYGKNAYDIYAETLQVDGLVSNTKKRYKIIFGTLKIN